MSEPTAFADRLEPVASSVSHWMVRDDRIEFRSDAYAVSTPEGRILIDPLPLSENALEALATVTAICLTAGQHQRSAWRYRKRFGATVYAPEGAGELEEAPDHWFADGVLLPGGLRAVSAAGVGPAHYALVMEVGDVGRVLFSGDLVVREDEGPFLLIPDSYTEDPAVVRDSVRRLLELAPDALCPAHGAPQTSGAAESLRNALARDS